MNVPTLLALIAIASLVFLIAPFILKGSSPSGRAFRGALSLIQLLPVSMAAIYFEYAETHLRIPIFSYERPHYSYVIGVVAILQIIVTTALVWAHPVSQIRKIILVCGAVFASVALSYIAVGVVNCINGNCF
jgi:hypothetical protein